MYLYSYHDLRIRVSRRALHTSIIVVCTVYRRSMRRGVYVMGGLWSLNQICQYIAIIYKRAW